MAEPKTAQKNPALHQWSQPPANFDHEAPKPIQPRGVAGQTRSPSPSSRRFEGTKKEGS